MFDSHVYCSCVHHCLHVPGCLQVLEGYPIVFMSVRRAQAYLYYSLAGWVAYGQGLPWDANAVTPSLEMHYVRYTNATYDGQAQLVVPGPAHSQYGGFLSTLHLEAVRDGLEDLELYKLLNRTVTAARQAGLDATSEAQALVIPAALVAGVAQSYDPFVRTFSEDPYGLRVQRLAVLRAIASLQRKLDH